MSNPIEQFRQAIAAAGLEAPDVIHDDGAIHRFSTNGRRGDDSGWYVSHTDGVPSGAFGCWRTGLQSTWCSKSDHDMTTAEVEAHRQRIKAMQAQREAEQVQRQQSARQTAAALWQQADLATVHPYLSIKGVKPHAIKQDGDKLLIPLRDTAGTLHSLQTIAPDGDKRFHSGGQVKGCYHAIGKPASCIVVCEGYATGASIHESTRDAVAVAFNKGNLRAVALALRDKYPALKIIIAADDDAHTAGNPGMTDATAAALAVGGLLAVPDFGAGRPDKATDFNDLHQLAGADAVRRCIEAAKPCTTAADDGSGWPEPSPLPDALPPVQAFSYSLLPDALRPWVADIAERMQCPPDFLAVGAMVAVSALVGARVQVQPKARDDWRVTPNLWGSIVGRPGAMKSPALNEVLKPLKRIETKKREAYEAQRESWDVSERLRKLQDGANETKAKAALKKNGDIEAARELLKAADLDPEPMAERLIVNDSSVPALAEIMRGNPWGVLLERDELYGLLKSMDSEGKEGDRAFYLTAFDGDKSYTVDRIMRGLNLHIPRLCLAMIGGIQPGRLSEYVRGAVAGGASDDGLVQRFQLAVWPDSSPDWRNVDQWPDTPARQAANAIFDRLEALPTPADEAPAWRFDDAAQVIFTEWRTELELRLRSDTLHPVLESHFAKYRKMVPALALLFALIDTPDAGHIGELELIRALAWADYLETHALRIYSAGVQPEAEGAAMLLKRIKAGVLADRDGVIVDSFTTRDVYRKGWQGLSTPEAARKAAEYLCEFDWLRRELVPAGAAGGRASEQYRINPAVLGGGAA